MRVWFDCEFMEDGKSIDLLSIGVVGEDDSSYYAEITDVDRRKANPWVRENVLPLLSGEPLWQRTRKQVTADLIEFAGDKPEWWAYYADYDWVVLCQLYGTMMDLPTSWPMYAYDLKQMADESDVWIDLEAIPRVGAEHHALTDATWCRDAWRHIIEQRMRQ
jgi:hypothetical protein